MSDAKKKASERLTELKAEGTTEADAKIIVKHEIRKGQTIDDNGPDVDDLDRDARAVSAALDGRSGGRRRVNKGDNPFGGDGDEDEYGEGQGGEGDEGAEDDEDEAEERAEKARERAANETREQREERKFIARMSSGIQKGMAPVFKETKKQLAELSVIAKAQGRLAVSQANALKEARLEIRGLKVQNETMAAELTMLKGSLLEPDGTFKARGSNGGDGQRRQPERSPYDGKSNGGGATNNGGGNSGGGGNGGPSYEALSAHVKGALRKASENKDDRQVGELKQIAAELSMAGADLAALGKRAGFNG